MKKKIVVAGLCLALAFSMAACGKDKDKKASSGNVQKVETNSENHEADMSGTKYAAKVTVPDYTTYKVAESFTKVSDELMKKIDFNVLIASSADFTNIDKIEGTVSEFDVVNIDFTGYVDGKEFEGGSAKDFNLGIGSNSFIDGFEDGLIGVKTGETVDLNLKFPDSYDNEDLKGKDVVFKVKVNYMLGMSDGYIKDNQELLSYFLYRYFATSATVNTEAEYREVVTNGVKVQNIIGAMFNDLRAEAVIEPNQIELDTFLAEILVPYEQAAAQNDMTVEEILKNYEGLETVEEFNEKNAEIYENMALMMKIAEDENISVSDEEYEKVANTMVFISGGQYADINAFEEENPKQDMVDDIIYGKVYYKVADSVQIVPDAEADYKPEDESAQETE